MSNLYALLLGGLSDGGAPREYRPLPTCREIESAPYGAPLVHYSDSVADRRPSPRKRGSSVGRVPDPFRRRWIYFESGLEHRHLVTLIANPAVSDIREQQTRTYLARGRRHRYTTDYLVTFNSGHKVAYEVKYAETAARKGTEALLQEVCEHVGDDLADEYKLLTELHVNDVAVANAKSIIECGRDFDIRGQEVVRASLMRAPATITLAEIGKLSGLGARGERAAMALIQQGALRFDPAEPLSPTVKLRNLCTQ